MAYINTQKSTILFLKDPKAHCQKKHKTAVSAPLCRALSHTSRRRSPGFAVWWRPKRPFECRGDGPGRPAGRRPPDAARRSLARSRGRGRGVGVGPSVVAVAVTVAVTVAVAVASLPRSFARVGWRVW